MTKPFLTLAAALALSAPALADPAPQKIEFKHDGINYVAKITYRDGVQHIDGRELQTGRYFALKVVNGQVTGSYDAAEVSYPVPTARAPIQTASR